MNPLRAVRTIETETGAVLQNTDNGATFSTNLVGARIWAHLTKGLTQGEVVDRLSSEFGVAKDQVHRDVEQFLTGLRQTGLWSKDGE